MGNIDHQARKASGTAHCFINPDLADEHYLFPIRFLPPSHEVETASVMIESLEDDNLIIAAQRLPGTGAYYNNYPEVLSKDEQLEAKHDAAKDRIKSALKMLEEFDPQVYTAETASGNKSLSAIWVQVSQKQRDDVLLSMWQVLNYLRKDYLTFLKQYESDKLEEFVTEYELLEHEVAEITN